MPASADCDDAAAWMWEGAEARADNVVLGSEADVEAFCDGRCEVEVLGSVSVTVQDLRDLAPLSCLRSVEGDLRVYRTEELRSLDGLDALTYVGGDLSIDDNLDLRRLSGLEALTEVGGQLEINSNDALTSIAGLAGLSTVGAGLSITFNEKLSSLSGLDALTHVGGGDLYIWSNASLTSLSGLGSLVTIDEDLRIGHCDALTSLAGLDALSSVGGYLELYEDDSLVSLEGLGAVRSIGESLGVTSCSGLTSLRGLDSLSAAGGVVIQSNELLTSMDGLQGITDIDDPVADPQRELAVAVRALTDHALDPAELPQAFVPLVGFGPVLSALSERLLLVGEQGGARWRCRLSRGGLLDQSCEPATPAPASLRLVFELDRLVFDDNARAAAAEDDALGGLVPGGPTHHPIGPEELVWDPGAVLDPAVS